MAYSNYGAFVRKDGIRREDKEDVVLFDDLCHGVLGDGDIRVKCYKTEPTIWERQFNGILTQIPISQNPFEYKGYHFKFKSGKPNVAIMIEPNGTKWECTYGFEYGAGWSKEALPMYVFTDSPIGIPKNKLVIYWEETVNGIVLWLLYDSNTDEHEAYVQFVKAVRQAVADHVLPAKLADYWYDWEDIVSTGDYLVNPYEQLPKQYTVIFTPNAEDDVVCSLCWKSTFESGFFA